MPKYDPCDSKLSSEVYSQATNRALSATVTKYFTAVEQSQERRPDADDWHLRMKAAPGRCD